MSNVVQKNPNFLTGRAQFVYYYVIKLRGEVMKKPQFKLWKEFKAFINRGSVLDLAVGMIIGSAFTAIVSALVNGILQPLINLIPIGQTGLQTVLRPEVVDPETGSVLVSSLILDWGAVISAVITFLLTALVLFIIIKVINSAKDIGKSQTEKLRKQLEKGKITEEEAAAAQAKLDEEAKAAEAPAPVDPTVALLTEIRDLLLAQKNVEAVSKIEEIASQE
ncbi:MAG: large conductance mechanosensitive channel protein MscL [Bacteroides sp.]|nr:large conductance mechanosensitive channel protein MscL [Bacillota bacterium]MCM1455168.1 large conductance mechanosensitive channel protein MscL [Bacteroides sp.]